MSTPQVPDPPITGEVPPAPPDREPVEQHRKHARIGLWLFAIYLLVYAAYILINVAFPQWAKAPAVAGLNVDIVYGLGLIVGAFLLAIIYTFLCWITTDKQA